MRSLWRRHFLAAESLAMLAIAGLFVLWGQTPDGSAFLDAQLRTMRQAVYGTVAAIAGSLLGFAIAALAIVVSMLGTSTRLVPVERHLEQLANVFTAAIVFLGIETLVSLVGLFLDRDASPQPWALYLVAAFLLLSVASLIRCTWALHQLVTGLTSGETRGATD